MNTCSVLTSELSGILMNNPLGQLRRLSVRENDTEVIITGQVSSYYFKQMAQETLRTAAGKRAIVNHVEVCCEEAA